MKILAMSDIHGSYDRAEAIIRSESPDVVIVGGDLTTVGSVEEAERAVVRFGACSPHLLCVAGNMDLPRHDELFVRRGVSVNARGVEIGGVGFFGVSACPFTPMHTPYELPEEEIAQRILAGYEDIRHCALKVLIPHAPPYGTRVDIVHAGFHVGSTAVRECIENLVPAAVVCGHIHEGRGQDTIGSTKIVNCGAATQGYYVILELTEDIHITNKRFSSLGVPPT